MSVQLGEWLTIVEREYLRRFVPGGGAAIKFIVSDDAGIVAARREFASICDERGFECMRVDAGATKLHMIQDVFFAVARLVDWSALAQDWVELMFRTHEYDWPRRGEPVPIAELSDLNNIDEALLRREVNRWLTQGIKRDREMAQDFRAAMSDLCMRRMEMDDQQTVAPVMEWLRGELRSIAAVRDVPISARITRHNGRAMLQSLCRWLWLAGRPGLALVVDFRQVAGGASGGGEGIRYTPAAALDALEVLRQLIDEIEALRGLCVLVLGDTAFEEDEKRGMRAYRALKERIWPDVHPKGRDNPLAPLVQVRQDDASSPVANADVGEMPFCDERVAIEALRTGVPNRSAIRLLGCAEDVLVERFGRKLAACRGNSSGPRLVEGEIVAGEFGTGKSHLLGALAERALTENFIVSRLAVSKETPLFDVDRLFAAAIRHAVVPRLNDDVMTAVVANLLDRKTSDYDRLESWASSPESGLSPVFAALLYLLPKQSMTPEDKAAVARFFGGAKLGTSRIKQWLRVAGAARIFDIRPVKVAELAVQRLRFAPRLFQAAGFGGWCILIDEAELIGRYSVLQRARSYAELGRWLGLSEEVGISGSVAVCAFTTDFNDQVLLGKLDIEKAPRKLEERGLDRQARLAEAAMEAISRSQNKLSAPSRQWLGRSLRGVAGLYEAAYGWRVPPTEVGQLEASKTVREHIKSWITDWDMQRLYGARQEIETERFASDYSENAAFESPPEADAEEDVES